MYTSSVDHCLPYLRYEFRQLNVAKVVFFGDTYDLFTKGLDIQHLINVTTGTKAVVKKAYNPAVLFYKDAKLKDAFYKQLEEVL